MRQWITVLVLVCVAVTAHAQFKPMTDLERVGTADLIIAGSIDKVVDAGTRTCMMTVRIGRVIKGAAEETVDIHNLLWLRGRATEEFREGKEFLFFLQSAREGYLLPRGMATISPIGQAAAIEHLVKHYPLTATVTEPLGAITVGQRILTPVTITFKNNTDTPIGVSAIDFQGFYLAPEMDATLSHTVGPEINGHHVAPWQVSTIEPGQEYVANLEFAGWMPVAWREKPPAPGTTAEVKVRFKVTVDIETPGKGDAETFYMNTALLATKVIMGEAKPVAETSDEW